MEDPTRYPFDIENDGAPSEDSYDHALNSGANATHLNTDGAFLRTGNDFTDESVLAIERDIVRDPPTRLPN